MTVFNVQTIVALNSAQRFKFAVHCDLSFWLFWFINVVNFQLPSQIFLLLIVFLLQGITMAVDSFQPYALIKTELSPMIVAVAEKTAISYPAQFAIEKNIVFELIEDLEI